MRTEILLRELLLSGLRVDYEPVCELFYGTVDWALIKRKAELQAISGVVFDGLLKLPDTCKPDKMFLFSWLADLSKIECSNKLLDSTLKDIQEFFHSKDISLILLKGQAVSRLYPIPEHRQCGDIDIITAENQFHKANALLSDYVDSSDSAYQKHTTYVKNGVVIELHNYMSRMFYPAHNKRWSRLMDMWLSKDPDKVTITDYSVNVLPATFNALYLFIHLFYHFIYSDGVGLRQLCDWALFIEKNSQSIDKAEFERMVNSLGLRKAVSVFGAIVIDYLGVEEDKFPIKIDKKFHEISRPVLNDILKGGSWGRQHYTISEKEGNSLIKRLKYYCFRFSRAYNYGYICRKEAYSYLVWRFFSAIFNWDIEEVE